MRADRRKALVELLQDEDAELAAIVIQEISQAKRLSEKELMGLLDQVGPAAQSAIRAALMHYRTRRLLTDLKRRCATLDSMESLEAFCWGLSDWFDPSSDSAGSIQFIEACAGRLRLSLKSCRCAASKLEALIVLMAEEEGFCGDKEMYYDPSNSFLTSVIQRRKGIPITLSALYMMVGRRAGLPIEGVGMPGHFIAKLGERFFDPFEGGILLDKGHLLACARNAGAPDPHTFLEAAAPRQIARRMVFNLLSIFEKQAACTHSTAFATIFKKLSAPVTH